jgi:hypothetical protein
VKEGKFYRENKEIDSMLRWKTRKGEFKERFFILHKHFIVKFDVRFLNSPRMKRQKTHLQ